MRQTGKPITFELAETGKSACSKTNRETNRGNGILWVWPVLQTVNFWRTNNIQLHSILCTDYSLGKMNNNFIFPFLGF